MCEKYVDKGVIIVMPAGNFGPETNTIGFTAQITKLFCMDQWKGVKKYPFSPSRDSSKPDFYVTGENVTVSTSSQGSLGRPTQHIQNNELSLGHA